MAEREHPQNSFGSNNTICQAERTHHHLVPAEGMSLLSLLRDVQPFHTKKGEQLKLLFASARNSRKQSTSPNMPAKLGDYRTNPVLFSSLGFVRASAVETTTQAENLWETLSSIIESVELEDPSVVSVAREGEMLISECFSILKTKEGTAQGVPRQ